MKPITAIRTLGLASIAAASLLASAAGVQADDKFAAAPPQPAHRVLATVEKDGRTFEFVQSTQEGIVGVAEFAQAGTPSLLTDPSLAETTPLELFVSLTGGARRAPDELVSDHKQTVAFEGRSDSQARTLDLGFVASAGTQAGSADHGGVGGDYCTYDEDYKPGDSQFTWSWYWTLGLTKDLTAQQTYQYEDAGGTAGRVWQAGVTSQRWLAACNDNWIAGFSNVEFNAEFKNPSGVWVSAYHKQLPPNYQVIYYSGTPGHTRWQVRLSEITYNVFPSRIYAVAVAGNSPINDFVSR